MSGFPFLTGVKVLEVTQFAADSLGGVLADFGADVVKVEPGDRGDPVRYLGTSAVGGPTGPSFNHLRWNRGKSSICLDLRLDSDARTFMDLSSRADVVIEGLRPGALGRLGLGWPVLRATNPRLVFASISGLGSSGPYSRLASHGHLYDAFAGLLRPDIGSDGEPHRPDRRGIEVGIHAYGLYGAVAVLSAVVRARAEGRGAYLDVAACDAAVAWMPGAIDAMLNADLVVDRADQTAGGAIGGWPRVEFYETRDGKVVAFQAMEDKFWVNFCNAVGRPDLLEQGRIADDAVKHRLWTELRSVFAARSQAAWLQLYLDADVAGGPVNDIEELAVDPHFVARFDLYEFDTPAGTARLLPPPVRVEGERFVPNPPPEVGADGPEVLLRWGDSEQST